MATWRVPSTMTAAMSGVVLEPAVWMMASGAKSATTRATAAPSRTSSRAAWGRANGSAENVV
jgi:hypothetical protein